MRIKINLPKEKKEFIEKHGNGNEFDTRTAYFVPFVFVKYKNGSYKMVVLEDMSDDEISIMKEMWESSKQVNS